MSQSHGTNGVGRAASMKRTEWGYEMKLLLPREQVPAVLAWARTHLDPDPHADPALEDGYRISSIYFDTPSFDVFHRVGPDRRRKYRVRRYGTESLHYLERKLKANGRVRKFRSWIPEEELTLLDEGPTDRDWSGDWFRRRLRVRQMAPVCRVTYLRVARVGELGGQFVRLTVDRELRASCASAICADATTDGVPLLTGEAILELKYPSFMPQAYKELVGELRLTPSSHSKYRTAVKRCGITASITRFATTLADGASPAPASWERAAPSVAAP